MSPVLGARAAESRHRIQEELAAFRVMAARPPSAYPRLQPQRHLPDPVVVTATDRAAQNAILRIVAVTEAFVFGLLVDKTQPQLPGDRLVEILWASEIQSAQTWDGRLKSWLRLHQVNVDDAAEYRVFRGCIDARNAIAHGLGYLTWHQRQGKRNVPAALKAVDIGVDGGRLSLTVRAIETCATRSIDLIRWLDGAAAARP
jgi:hypothetical protein